MKKDLSKTIKILSGGGIGVLPTDTLYGLVGQALWPAAVERIYQIRKRRPDKPSIILISSLNDLKLFGIRADEKTKRILGRLWPGPVSVVLPCPVKKLEYLHRGTDSLALRLPDKEDLVEFLKKTGPLIAPSANPEDLPPALTITEAKKYFGRQVDFYVDVGRLESEPSTLVKLEEGRLTVLRQGKFVVSDDLARGI